MRDTMVHRGPDDAGLWSSAEGPVGMGHRRLSIVDLSPAGRGPMTNEDGSIVLSFNGEIYNYLELRKRLADRHSFRSRTDTEVIVHLYEERGLAFLDDLRGMFALSLWDSRNRRLVLARDRVGEKPLYYAEFDGSLVWASEIKALLAYPAARAGLNEAALLDYLSYGAVPAPQTLFDAVLKLPPGHMLVREGSEEPRLVRYWSPLQSARDEPPIDDEEDAVAQLRALVRSAVTERTMADVPHGLFLSGGVDSSFVLALLAAETSEPVRTFSVGFEEQPRFDERAIAAGVARRFGTNHTEIVLGANEARDAVPELIYGQDEPISDWVCIPLMLLSRAVRKSGTIVVQVGEGADELFAGYPRYRRYAKVNGAWSAYAAMPRPIRALGSALGARILGRFGGMREPADLLFRAGRGEPLFISGAVAHWEREKQAMLSGRGRELASRVVSSAQRSRENQDEYWRMLPTGDYAGAMAYQDLMIRLPELLLMRVDKMTMLSSIEARAPFLDHRIIEFAFRTSERLKLRHGRTKHILKEAAAPLLGSEIVDRPKVGFDVPLAGWLREAELGGWAERVVMDSGLLKHELLDTAALRSVFNRHRSGAADFGYRIWNLVNAAAWYDHWIA